MLVPTGDIRGQVDRGYLARSLELSDHLDHHQLPQQGRGDRRDGPDRRRRLAAAAVVSPYGAPLSSTTSAISASLRPDGCRGVTRAVCAAEVIAMSR